MGLRVHLIRQRKLADVDTLGVKRFARSVLRAEDITEGGLTLVLTDNAGIREYNARFRNMDGHTDVLSFPLHEDDEVGRYLGDVIISVEQARHQAPRFENTVEAELARLVCHGILHILGYDHHTPAEGKQMKAAERRALSHHVPGSLLRDDGQEGERV